MNVQLHQRCYLFLFLIVGVVRVTPTAALATEQRPSTNQRQPWEFGRFVRQSSKFVTLPFLPSSASTSASATVIRPGSVVWQPSAAWGTATSVPPFSFGPLDDVVMGGASSSTFDNDGGIWKGSVTDANNGGFIGIRSFPAFKWDMTGCQGIELKLRQRGENDQRFKIVLRDSTDFNGVCWTTSVYVRGSGGRIGGSIPSYMKLFRPKDDVAPNDSSESTTTTTTVRIPFDKQIPTLFAKTVTGTTTFQKDSIVGVQLAYSKFEYDGALNPKFAVGDIQLEILEIKAY